MRGIKCRWVSGVVGALALTIVSSGTASAVEGTPGFTSTTATKHVTVIDRTDLPDAPASACGAAAIEPALVTETSTTTEVTTAIVTVGPATIYIGEEQSVEYHVVAGEVDTTTLVTTTTTLHQTWQGTAAGEPCPTEATTTLVATTQAAPAPVSPQAAPATPVTATPTLTG